MMKTHGNGYQTRLSLIEQALCAYSTIRPRIRQEFGTTGNNDGQDNFFFTGGAISKATARDTNKWYVHLICDTTTVSTKEADDGQEEQEERQG
jgi:hypothetical protein